MWRRSIPASSFLHPQPPSNPRSLPAILQSASSLIQIKSLHSLYSLNIRNILFSTTYGQSIQNPMRHLISLLSLPNSLLLLLSVSPSPVTPEEPWPYNLPKHLKYFPEDEVHIKRGLKIQERLARESPIGVKKMSADEGEMFFPDYWLFGGEREAENTDRRGPLNLERREQDFSQHSHNWSSSDELSDNSNTSLPIFSPLRPHSDQIGLHGFYHRYIQRDTLFARGFRCPDGTSNCSSIGQPDSCCSTADSCISITDTGYGTVGCCPIGQTCAGSISCDTANGYSSCPNSPNGGCCLPGYVCYGVGCK